MAKTKEIKKYQTTVADGRMSVRMLEKGADGIYHSASCEYPLILQEQDPETGKAIMVRKTKKQTEKWLLSVLGFNA